MDLIILIVFVALAMLISNIKAVKRRQADMESQQESQEMEEEIAAENIPHRRPRNQWEELLKQLIGEANLNRNAEQIEETSYEIIDTEETIGSSHLDSAPATERLNRQSMSTGTVTDCMVTTVEKSRNTAAIAVGNTDTTTDSTIDTTDEEQPLRDDFDLRRAVLYSEILKPKFDNYQD